MARVLETPLDRITPPQPGTRATGPVIAVDLGTSNLRLAAFHQGRATPLVASRQRTPPSVIAVGTRGNIVVGQAAEQQASSNPELAVWGIKHLVAGKFQSPQIRALRERLSCQLFEGPNGQCGVQLGDRSFSPRELVAMLLSEARSRSQEILGQPVYRAVIAVPARRDDSFRDFMNGAAALAGLHLMATMSTPASAIAHAKVRTAGHVGVFDWGGGGFEFSVVQMGPKPELVATQSDASIGGSELDQMLLNYLLSALDDGHPLRGELSAATRYRILAAAERAKILLTTQPTANVRVPFIGDMASGQSFEATLRRDELNQLLEPLLQRVMKHIEGVLDSRGLFPGDVTELVCIGEQSAIPLVQDRLKTLFPESKIRVEHPGDAVVLGACEAAAKAHDPSSQLRR